MLRLGVPIRAFHTVKVQQSASRKGGKAVRKGDLPSKTCVCCGRPFTWRKKWETCWDEVRHACSLPFTTVANAEQHSLQVPFTGFAATGAATRVNESERPQRLQASCCLSAARCTCCDLVQKASK